MHACIVKHLDNLLVLCHGLGQFVYNKQKYSGIDNVFFYNKQIIIINSKFNMYI